MEELQKIISEIANDKVIKVVISNKLSKENLYNKIIIELKEKKSEEYYQIEKFTDKQVFHENIKSNELEKKLYSLIANKYKQVNIWNENSTCEIKISKKGKIFFTKKNSDNSKVINKNHNKQKNYILKEGMIIEPLIDLGVFTKEGKVINSKYDKYKQINRFIEIIDDEIKKSNFDKITVLDFGCGKSYLTFVLYYYLVEIKKIDATIIGLDLKQDVIKKCNDIAKKYGYSKLSFELGDINGYKYTDKVDMVLTLHACDTATDYALYNAINWNAKLIFSVPCCQHEFNEQFKTEEFSVLSKYGIVKERVSALMTDAVRGNLLEVMGYRTQLLEFIDIAHSPKNILIRAAKETIKEEAKNKALTEVESLMKEFNLKPTLYKLLRDNNSI